MDAAYPRHDHILAVPISFKKLLTKKLIVCGVLSIIFGLICSLFTIIAEMIVRFPGFEISLALKATLQITAVNFFLYLAVLVPGVRDPVLSGATNRFLSENRKPIDRIS